MTKRLRRLFPRLFGDQYRLASKKTRRYNCLAWAHGDTEKWREAVPDGWWPPGVLDDGSAEAAIQLFEYLGYRRTTDRGCEAGAQKVAIYGDDQGYTHAARQLSNGRWTSKLGKSQDIEHDTLENLVGREYGNVVQILEKHNEPQVD